MPNIKEKVEPAVAGDVTALSGPEQQRTTADGSGSNTTIINFGQDLANEKSEPALRSKDFSHTSAVGFGGGGSKTKTQPRAESTGISVSNHMQIIITSNGSQLLEVKQPQSATDVKRVDGVHEYVLKLLTQMQLEDYQHQQDEQSYEEHDYYYNDWNEDDEGDDGEPTDGENQY
jgi:hypothetical protein